MQSRPALNSEDDQPPASTLIRVATGSCFAPGFTWCEGQDMASYGCWPSLLPVESYCQHVQCLRFAIGSWYNHQTDIGFCALAS